MTKTEIKQAELATIKDTIKDVLGIDIDIEPEELKGEQLEYQIRSKLDLLIILLAKRKLSIESEIETAQKELELTNTRISVFGDMQ